MIMIHRSRYFFLRRCKNRDYAVIVSKRITRKIVVKTVLVLPRKGQELPKRARPIHRPKTAKEPIGVFNENMNKIRENGEEKICIRNNSHI